MSPISVFVIIIIPFAILFYEAWEYKLGDGGKGTDSTTSCKEQCCSALRWQFVFSFVGCVILLILYAVFNKVSIPINSFPVASTAAFAPAAGALRNLLHANASNRDAASTAGAAPVLAKLLTDPEIEDAGARKHAAALLKSMAAADPNGVAAALQCDADRVVIGLEIDRRLATKPVDTMRRSTSQKTLAAMMRRLTPKSSSSKKNVVTSK